MVTKALIKHNTYTDSMSLMALSTKVNELDIVDRAMIGMATDMNKQLIANADMMTPEIEAATTSDMVIVVRAETEELCDQAFEEVERLRQEMQSEMDSKQAFSSLDQAMSDDEGGIVMISVPGDHAAAEAEKALRQNKNVMIFSDNVAIEDEIRLKNYAHERGLLVMGPDCGTAIINGTGLAFANAVNDGPVGIVAASGAGAQELSVRVDGLGGGVSQLIGVGGRDLSEPVGGIMMLDGMKMLDEHDETKVVVLISKPPADSVAEKIITAAKALSKPVVICFIGDNPRAEIDGNLTFTHNTKEAALAAVRLATDNPSLAEVEPETISEKPNWQPDQTNIRGLFCGGTICDEVFYVVKDKLDNTFSNVAKKEADVLPVGAASHDNVMLDLGSDEFTQGRPHPMIDPSLRNERLVEEAKDPTVAVILLDFVLGFGSHKDPVGASLPAITEAQAIAREAGRPLEIVAYVLGTDRDFQGKQAQIDKLTQAGVKLSPSVVDLGAIALDLINK